MSKELKDLLLEIKDLEAEYDYYCLHEPNDTESMERIKGRIINANNKYDDLNKRVEQEKLDGVKESSFSK
jgi:hypothetical protein